MFIKRFLFDNKTFIEDKFEFERLKIVGKVIQFHTFVRIFWKKYQDNKTIFRSACIFAILYNRIIL